MKLIAFWEKKNYIGSYQLEEQIGIGGMGIVYRVRSLMDSSKTYALKAMKEEHLLDEVQKKRFKNESLLVDRIDHPNIVRVYERGEDNGKLYIVMEYLQGLTLAERYDIRNYPSLNQCIHIMSQVADVLESLQGEGIVHRDLKPENIMLVDYNGDPDYVKLLDFGIARVHSFSHLTETGLVIGTLPYMPPEVVSDGTVSSMVDIYSLGVIGYEMLTRRKPFQADTPIASIKQIVEHTPELPSAINLDVPRQMDRLIMNMMAKDPAHRPSPRKVKAKLADIF